MSSVVSNTKVCFWSRSYCTSSHMSLFFPVLMFQSSTHSSCQEQSRSWLMQKIENKSFSEFAFVFLSLLTPSCILCLAFYLFHVAGRSTLKVAQKWVPLTVNFLMVSSFTPFFSFQQMESSCPQKLMKIGRWHCQITKKIMSHLLRSVWQNVECFCHFPDTILYLTMARGQVLSFR